MAAPTLEFVESGRAPFELGDGEVIVERLRFTRDSLGGTWAEATDGTSALHNGRPLQGRARLADGDELKVGDTRLRFTIPGDDWTTVSDPPEGIKSLAPPLPPSSSPLPMPPPSSSPLPSLADDFDSPQTQQMSPEEVKRLTQGASRPVFTAPPPSDGPEALPPPPVAESPSGPGLVLPPPVSATAKSRLASAFAQTMMPDPDFGPRVPPPPPPRITPADSEAVTGSVEVSDVREMSDVSGVEVTSGISDAGEVSRISTVETTTGVLREPTTGVMGDRVETTTGVLREPTTGVLVDGAEPTTGVMGAEATTGVMGDSVDTTTGVMGAGSAIVVPPIDPEQHPSREVTRPAQTRRSGRFAAGPATGPTNQVRLPGERPDATTQPSLTAIELPTPDGAGLRARKFVRALLAAPSVRGVLVLDLAWAIPFGVLLGWVSTRTGDAWLLACLGGVTLLAIATFVAGARVAPKVSGLTLASARGQLAVGVSADVVAVGRLRAWVGAPLALVALTTLLVGARTVAGTVGFFVLIAAGLVFDAWLRSAYVACFAAWARACERAQSLDVQLAPPPLAKAFER